MKYGTCDVLINMRVILIVMGQLGGQRTCYVRQCKDNALKVIIKFHNLNCPFGRKIVSAFYYLASNSDYTFRHDEIDAIITSHF